MRNLSFLILNLSFLILAQASDSWPEFRGPGKQGHSDSTGVPVKWSETENVKWKSEIPGEGWSSPVIEGNEIWMTTATEEGKSLRALCADLSTGKLIHNIEVFRLEKALFKHKLNSHASPTPVIDGDVVYVCFGTNGTAAIERKSGKKLWENLELKIDHENGPGSSPTIYKDKLILCCDGIDLQYLVALDKATGKIAWKTNRSQKIDKVVNMKKAYCIPLIINVGGKDQCITPAAEQVYSYDPDTGKELWFIKHPGFSNVPRPVYENGLLVVCTGFMRPEIWGMKPGDPAKGESGNLTKTHVLWKVAIQAPTQPSPVLINKRVYMVSDTGAVTCINGETGATVWKQALGGEYSASPVYVDGHIYFCDRVGHTTIIEPGDTYKLVSKNTLEEGFMASPAVVGKALILRTKKALYRIEK